MVDPSLFFMVAVIIAGVMLLWDTVEVGRNDAANIVNAVFGARILKRKTAVYIAGFAVILGAWASSPVMETTRKGIFDPSMLDPELALTIYVCVYITDTVLLYTFSMFGMPVSTTAQLIFALLGGAFVLGGPEIIGWETSTNVILAIILSIFISGILSYVVQKVFRPCIGENTTDEAKIKRHGPWIAGLLITGLFEFMIMKGLKSVQVVKDFKAAYSSEPTETAILLGSIWIVSTTLVWLFFWIGKQWAYQRIFPFLAIIGMIALAVAFGQNDLANAASPGVASYMIYQHGELAAKEDVPQWLLLVCGILLCLGMTTNPAQRVTRSEANTGSQGDIVRLYAPKWCLAIANFMLRRRRPLEYTPDHLPKNKNQKVQHYDALRATIITSVSASVIAIASGMGLPVSTTYVTFVAVIATGAADKIFVHGDAALKLGRTIWVVFTWFTSAFLSAATTGVCVLIVKYLGIVGIFLCIGLNLLIRRSMTKRSDKQEEQLRIEAAVRKQKILDSVAHGNTIVFASEEDDENN